MSLNNKHCLLFLVIFGILLFGVSIASATEVQDVNHTQEIMDDIKLSTPDNYDVDKVVQSSTSQSSTDAEVKNYNKSDKTINSENTEIANIKTEKTTNTNENNIISKNTNLNKNLQRNYKTEGEGTFTQLQLNIDENSEIELLQDYQFTSGTDDGLVYGIVINKNIIINGNGRTIDAKNLARIFKISGTDIDVKLINIKLVNANSTSADNDGNGGAIYTDSHIIIEDCTFTNNGANNGGAIFATKQSGADYVDELTIKNCNFTDNVALVNGGAINIFEESINTKILDSNFTNNRVIGYNNSDNTRWFGDGGAICFNKTSSNTLIDNSIFTNNSVNANGGAILWKGSYGNITNSKFYNNSAPYAAGALRLDGGNVLVNNSVFEGNYDSHGDNAWGSAIYLTGANCNITYSNFTGNTKSKNGGAIAIDGSNNIIDYDNFENNSAYIGGAVFICNNDNVIINNTNFTNNNATHGGGAINIDDQALNSKILNSNFINNRAIGYIDDSGYTQGTGGAINFGKGCSNGKIDNSTFINNTAKGNGGAVEWNGDDGVINSSTFINNSAEWSGGAVRFTGNNGNVTSSKFYNNTVYHTGGALRLIGNNTFVNDTLFEGNYDSNSTPYAWGLAIYLSGHNANISYSNFTHNYGGDSAGAIYVEGANATIDYSRFENNTSKSNAGAIYIQGNNALIVYNSIENNNASTAGAIYITGTNTTIKYTNMTGNKATKSHGGALYAAGNHAEIAFNNFDSNSASNQGGAIYWSAGYSGDIITDCNFTSNYAKNAGGTIFWERSSEVKILNSIFKNCTHGNNHGGAIDLYSNAFGVVDNCTFINCTSAKDGGAIYFANSNGASKNSTLSNCYFINCTSKTRYGGAFVWKEPNGLIVNVTCINCSSEYSGGAIAFDTGACNNQLINVTCENCSAKEDGGAIYYKAFNGQKPIPVNNTHINCTFINNRAGSNHDGGAIAFEQKYNAGNNTYDGCKFVNNSARYGGSIYYSVNSGIIVINSIFANNSNVTDGGFIYLNGSKVNITNNTFYNGSAVNGGALYVNTLSNDYIRNNTFDYNNATLGGAVYVAGAVKLNDSAFTNNTAENGGAMYITADTTLYNCNLTNNNATNGSAIYVKSGKLTLKTVRLIANQAKSDKFIELNSDEVVGDKRVVSGVFAGCDNYLNALYIVGGNELDFNDVYYCGLRDDNGDVIIVNFDDTQPTFISDNFNESGQVIILEMRDIDNNEYILEGYTDENGYFRFEFDDGEYSFKVYHPEDEYYTELVDNFGKTSVTIVANATNITYGKTETIKINVTGDGTIIPTGYVTVYVNNTEGYDNLTFTDIPLEEDGTVVITIPQSPESIDDYLNVSKYDVYVKYDGDDHYIFGRNTTDFEVTKAKTSLNISIDNYTYNNTETITFNLTVDNDNNDSVTGKIFVNITGTESDGTPFSLKDLEINITRDENGNIVNNTYTLPILNATGVDNNYEIVAVSEETNNYNSTTNSTTFKVFKAEPVINVTAYNITTDGIFAVDVHIEPEVATGDIIISIKNSNGEEVSRITGVNLVDSRNTTELAKLPKGEYTVNVTYSGDKNHFDSRYNDTKFEVLFDDFPIDIQLTDMTYGETQIITVTVPKDYEGTLTIKLNGTELTDEYYTIEEGVIYIDTAGLTNIIEDGILVVGEYNLSVNYTPAEGDYYRANATEKLFNVNRADPTIIITPEEIGYLSNETITINLTSYNATGKINITVINITEDGSTYTNYSVDINNDTLVTVVIPDLEIGTYNVIVEYCNDTNYNNKTFTETFKVLPLVISIIRDRPEIYVDEFETIFGSVTDISGRKITTGKVNITISNESGYVTSYLIDLDSESGLYNSTNRYSTEGTFYANATYLLDNKIIANSSKVSFTVSKIPTITNVSIVNSTVYGVTIDVSVKENATETETTTGHHDAVTEGKLNITVNGESKLFDITGSTTTIVLDVEPVNIDTTETVDLTVEYIGDYKHNASKGIDNTTSEEITEFTATPIGSNVTISVVENTVMVRQNVTVSGQVFDDLGNLIKSGKVNVSIDGVYIGEYDINETTGIYTLNYTTSKVKEVNVEVNFTGIKVADDSKYIVLPSTNTTTFTVEKIPTITNVEILNHTLGNVTIRVNVTGIDDLDKFVTIGLVDVYSFTQKDIINPGVNVSNKYVDIKLNGITKPGDEVIGVFYQENTIYFRSNARNESAPIDFDKDTILIHVTGMPSITNIEEILCDKVGNVTLAINVTNVTGQLVENGHVIVVNATSGEVLGEGNIDDGSGKVNITLTGVDEIGEIKVNVTFEGNDLYLPSNALGINAPADEEYTSVITVLHDPSIEIEVLNPEVFIGQTVNIKVTVLNESNEALTTGTVNVYINGTEYSATLENDVYMLHHVTSVAGVFNVNATYTDDSHVLITTNDTFTVNKIPTITNVTSINSTFGNVTIKVNVTDDIAKELVNKGTFTVYDSFGNELNVTDISVSGNDVIINISDSVNKVGPFQIAVYYDENDIFMASNAINESATNPVSRNLFTIDIERLDSNITVSVNTTVTTIGENVTINGTLTDAMGNNISFADIVVYVDGNAYPLTTNSTGGYKLNYTTTRVGNITVSAKFDGGNNYNPSSDETSFNVTKISTKTNVTIVNNTIGNVVIHVNVTNLTNNPVERGHVVVCNQTGQIVGEGELANGGVDITLNVNTIGNIKVNVTYQENDIYYGSNSTNSSITSMDDPEINITNINVVKQEASISIGLNPEVLIVGENVYIRGTVAVNGNFITNGKVNVTVNGTNTTVDINSDGSYNLTFNAVNADKYTVNATYLGNDSIDSITSENVYFTVNKIPTNTTITVINNTAGNVTIEVTVTNSSGAPVSMGDIRVEFEDGTPIVETTLTNGKVNVTIPSSSTDTLKVNVTYIENSQYQESKNNTEIEVVKQDAAITIEIIKDNVTIGDGVIITGKVYDGMGNVIQSGDVDVIIDGLVIPTTITGGKYTVENATPTAGVYKVNATYKGNATVNKVTSDTLEFTVNKMPTIVTISPISDVEVDKEFTIEVTLTNNTGQAISGKTISITVNDQPLENVPVTDSDGKTSVKYTPVDNTDLVIKAVYLPTEEEEYLGNESETTVKVGMSQSTITVKVDKKDSYVGESVKIYGTLKDRQGKNITTATVSLYVNGKFIKNLITDDYGNYSYVIRNLIDGEYNVEVVYEGVPNAIIGDTDRTSYNVNKMPTNIEITLPSEVEVFVPFDIEVTLTNNTGNANPIAGKNVIITVNGEVINNVPETDGEGKTKVTYTPQNNSTITVKAEFIEDDYYFGKVDEKTIASENIHISKSNITVHVNDSQLYVDESVEITGKLTDEYGNAIPLANVKISINDTYIDTVETNSSGEYSFVVNNLNKGNYEVHVVYDGVDDVRDSCENFTTYVVSLIPTITEVTVINSTVGNVTIDVVVKENVTGRHTGIVSAGTFEVTVNGNTEPYPINGQNTTVRLDGNAFIDTTDEVSFNVKYIENMKYESSNGVNSSTGEEITKFKADSQQSTVTVKVTPESQSYGAEVIISGHVYDGMGDEITSGYVYITVNDGTPIEVPLNDNGYSKEYISDNVGINDVKVEFKDVLTEDSNILIKGSNAETTFNVDRIPTTTTVEIINNTAGNVTIEISVAGVDGNRSMTGKVNITIDGSTLQVDLDGSESIVVPLRDNITRSGNINVTVAFDGNEVYLPSDGTIGEDVLKNITVDNTTALLTVDVNDSSVINGSSVTIYGNLTDDMGNNITDAYVTVYVNGERVDTVKTNSTGGYSFDYVAGSVGVNDVVVTYDGDYIRYSNATGSTSFDVIKLNSTVVVDVAGITFGDVESINISINESDASGSVTVYVNSTVSGFMNITRVLTLVDAGAQLNLSDLGAGTYNVTVVYDGDSKYNGNSTLVEFTVDRLADYDVNITTVNITYGEDETITVKLPEDATGSVTISIDGIIIDEDTKVLSGGVAEFSVPKYTGLVVGDYTVLVSYSGDSNYVGKDDLAGEFRVSKAESHINVVADNVRSDEEAGAVLNISDFNATGKAVVTLLDSDNVQVGDAIIVDSMTFDAESKVSFGKLLPGMYTVNVTYYDDDNYNDSEASATFAVGQIPTTTEVTILNNTAGNVTIDIKVTGEDGNTSITGTVNVTVNGHTIPVELTGTVNKTIKLDIEDSGVNYVKVEFTGNDNYLSSIGNNTDTNKELTNITVTKQIATITVNATPSKVTIGQIVNITGKLTDGMNNVIPYAYIEVTLNGERYITTTDSNGEYSLTNVTVKKEVVDVVATYKGNKTVNATSANTNFTVDKIPTTTLVSIVNTTVGNVSIDVIVKDNNGSAVTTGKLNITTEYGTLTVDISGQTTNIPLDYNTNGTKHVSVEYIENDVYYNSTGLDKVSYDINPENADIFNNITVTRQNTTITVTTITPVKVGNSTIISGKLVDEQSRPINGAKVVVIIDDEKYNVTTNANGEYSLEYNDTIVGTHNVESIYNGNETFIGSNDTTNFEVEKRDAKISIEKIEDVPVGNDLKIIGKLEDEFGIPIKDTEINVTFDGNTQTIKTDNEGNFNVRFPTSSVGTKDVSIDFSGNENYTETSLTDTANIEPIKASIIIDTPSDVEAGEPVNITGTVTDEDGKILSGVPVNVTVNGETKEVVTDENGRFSVPFDNVVPGQNNITATSDDENYDIDETKDKFFVPVLNTNISVDSIDDTLIGDDVVVSGKLLDENGKAIGGAEVTVTVDGVEQTVITDKDGKYTATFPTDSVGTKDVKVEYTGNEKYNSAKEDTKANVVPINGTLTLELPTDAVVGEPTTINGTLTNQDGKAVPNTPVNITVNGKVYSTTTDENGKFTIPIDNVVVGTNNVTASAGNENITVKDAADTFNANKKNSILTVDPIDDSKVGDNITITGQLTDERGNPISNAVVTITLNGEEFNVTTDSEGNYELPLTNTKAGLKNVSVTFESENYNSATNSTNFTVTKIKTILTVEPVIGTVGEKITLVAHVTDEYGNNVSGGNLVFKINGRTLRMDGRFDTNDTDPMKFKVVDGIVTYTMNVELYLRAGKNITASYSGSYRYEEAKGNVASVGIRKRNAELTVEVVPNTAKQNSDVVFIVKLRDVTPNGTNKTCITTNAGLILKVNGITLRNEDGKVVYVNADSTTVTYTYHVPTGMAGVDNNGNIRNYTVEAVYNNSMFYPDTRNTTEFHVQRSIVNINYEDVTIKNNVLSIKATFTDYENNLLVGDNKICVKINGITYKENNQAKYFTVHNGIVDLTGLKIDDGTKVKSVTLVTGDRSAYLSARETTKDISTS